MQTRAQELGQRNISHEDLAVMYSSAGLSTNAKVQDSMDLRAVPVCAVLCLITPEERHCSPKSDSALAENCLERARANIYFFIFVPQFSWLVLCRTGCLIASQTTAVISTWFSCCLSRLALPSDNKVVLQRVSGYEEIIKAPVLLQLSLYCLWFNCPYLLQWEKCNMQVGKHGIAQPAVRSGSGLCSFIGLLHQKHLCLLHHPASMWDQAASGLIPWHQPCTFPLLSLL